MVPLLNTGRDHLLVYAFSYSDDQFLENLKYFIREAVANDTVADYLIIVQEGPGLQVCCCCWWRVGVHLLRLAGCGLPPVQQPLPPEAPPQPGIAWVPQSQPARCRSSQAIKQKSLSAGAT